MMMQTRVRRVRRCLNVGGNPEIDFESFAPVVMMSSIGLTLSFLVVILVGS
jgi:hypothetical protein